MGLRLHVGGYLEKALLAAGVRRTDGLYLPDFLGIGAVKAGTTWLHRNLYRHPELFLCVKKPVWYFDKNFARPLAEYSSIFEAAGGRCKGEITGSYSILPLWKILFLRRIMPNLRLILLLRHPVARDWSDIRMELSVIRKIPREDWTEELLLETSRSDKICRQGDYRTIINNWSRVFPVDQLYLGVFERMVAHPQRVLGEIFDFLGVSRNVEWDRFPTTEVVFKGADVEMPPAVRAELERRHDRREVDEISRLIDVDLGRLWGAEATP